jgi:glycosyltransferase involved in cell wall biosynthesis
VDCLIAVANSVKELIFNHFGKDAIVLHNMIGEEFLNIPKMKWRKNNKINIVATGSLIHRKGFDVLIKALAKVNSKMPDWELQIIGEGEERDSLQLLIDNQKLGDKVHLIGRRTKKEIIDIYSESDFFVLPSRAENFSVAVLEALAAGMPVVATICGGIRECIDEKNGLLVPVDDVDDLSNKLLDMSINLDRYNSDYIKGNCIQRFAPSVIAQKLTKIYEAVK